MPILVFLWSEFILLLWWAAQWPADLSYDSMSYVRHVTTGPWDQSHSVVYDAMILMSLTLTNNVWLLTLVQTLVWSAVLAYFASAVRDWGVRGRWAAIPALVLPLLPSFGAFASTIWKDVPFAICEVMLAATLLKLVRVWRIPPKVKEGSSEPVAKQPIPWRLLAAVGVELLGLAVFRNNGAVMVLVITIVLGIVMRGLRIRLITLGAAAIAIYLLANTVIYPAAGIARGNQQAGTYVTLYGDIAVVYSEAPGSFTASDKALMRKVAPLATWKAANNCYASDNLYQGKHFHYANAAKYEPQMIKLWLRVLKRTPVAVAKTRLCRSSVAWNPFDASSKKGVLAWVPLAVPADLYGFNRYVPADVVSALQTQPLSHRLADVRRTVIQKTASEPWHALVWRGALWSYVCYICLFIASRRMRNWRLLTVGVVCLANQLMVMLANPSQLFRYMAGPIFIGVLIVPIVLARRPAPEVADAIDSGPDQHEIGERSGADDASDDARVAG